MIPDTIKIGPHVFRVRRVRPDRTDDLGCCNLETLELFVREDIHISLQLETLLHEALHAIRKLTCTELEDADKEESCVQVMSMMLYSMLSENRNLSFTEQAPERVESPLSRFPEHPKFEAHDTPLTDVPMKKPIPGFKKPEEKKRTSGWHKQNARTVVPKKKGPKKKEKESFGDSPYAKLLEEKRSGMSVKDLAKKYGVSGVTIYARLKEAMGVGDGRSELVLSKASDLSPEIVRKIRDMSSHDMTTSEIATELDLEYEDVASVTVHRATEKTKRRSAVDEMNDTEQVQNLYDEGRSIEEIIEEMPQFKGREKDVEEIIAWHQKV